MREGRGREMSPPSKYANKSQSQRIDIFYLNKSMFFCIQQIPYKEAYILFTKKA